MRAYLISARIVGAFRRGVPALALAAAVIAGAAPARAAATSYSTDFDSMTPGSIFGQEGWTDLDNATPNSSNLYVQGVTTAAAHSGTQSWLLSNAWNDGTVATIAPPTFAAVGESNCVYGQQPAYNHFSEQFWFRSVSTSDDPGLYVSNSLGCAASVRNTYVRIHESAGGLYVDAIGNYNPTTEDFDANPSTGVLQWGQWYEVKVDATFVDGANNDAVRYQVLDANGNSLMDSTIGSWEGYYTDPNIGPEDYPGPIASNRITWGLANTPGVAGVYIDDMSMAVSAVPEPASMALLALGGLTLLRRKRR